METLRGSKAPQGSANSLRELTEADSGARTHDLPLTRRVLYQLSYIGKWASRPVGRSAIEQLI